jgi:CelD/BcsL family acetyltransferase involved in cellulose biosynthesis
MLTARRITGLAGLRALRDDWRSLHDGAALYARYEWHLALARNWLEESKLAYLQVLDGERTVAIVPMVASSVSLWPFGTLPALSLGLREELADFPVAAGAAIEEVVAAVRAALEQWPERWEALRWPRALASSNITRLAAGFEPVIRHVLPEENCNLLDTSRPFAEVEAGWSKNMRRSLTRSRKRLGESGGMRLTRNGAPMDGARAGSATRQEDRAAAYETFLELEASGWKAAAGSAIRAIPAQRGFLADLLDAHAADFSPEVILLWRGDKPVAGEYTVTVDGCRHLLKIGYDEAEKRYGPGQVLMAAIIEDACAKGLARVNLVTDMEWHPSWRPAPEASFEIVIFRSRWRARLYQALLRIRRAVKTAGAAARP